MTIDVRLLAELNLAVQLILALVLLIAFRLAKDRNFKKHCTVMRIAVPIQILVVLGIMLPSMYGYEQNISTGHLFFLEILVHHVLGLGVLALWVYINLIFMKLLNPLLKIRIAMRLALVFWAASMVLGLHLYFVAYLM
jgi:uncharacterized membrane protein YozB (DUF420 family)